MKGLYVYGALLMGMSFITGAIHGSTTVMAISLAACAVAALSEAANECAECVEFSARGVSHLESRALIGLAVASWAATALAALTAILTII